ncbi:hypothetical protein L2E82_16800 [Cichorium intybus]|uniref:Uncharacterized protein n=1 Tax=Cichorium intybus TaxID=13427 RepID=A0ACB9F772_CICIN|nr:hypothetical protein L2E82_16800 [Cichorium intybus]
MMAHIALRVELKLFIPILDPNGGGKALHLGFSLHGVSTLHRSAGVLRLGYGKEEAAHQHQFILHAALDVVQDLAWTTSAMYSKSIDRFNDLVVSVYVTAGHILFCFFVHTRLMLLHDSRNEDGIKTFFQEVHELYIKILLNPLYLPGSRVTSSHFDTKVRALARRYL